MTSRTRLSAATLKVPFTIVERNYFLFSLVLILILASVSLSAQRGPFIELYDYGEHAACIRELSVHPFSPRNPMLTADGSTTLRYTPYMLLLALTKKVFHLNIFTIINLASIISFFLFIVGVYLWSKEYFKSEVLPLYVLVTLLFLWGKPFDYSNEYNFRFLMYTSFYPSTFVFNLSFLGLYFLLNYTRYESYRNYLLYLLVATFAFLTHPLTGSFFLLSSFIVTITEGENRLKNWWLFCLSLLIIALCSLLWPYYSFIDAVIKSTTTDWYSSFRMYLYEAKNIYKMGPALLGLPLIFLFFVKRKYPFISLGFVSCSLIYVLSYSVNIRLGERYIFFMIFFLHLSLAWYCSTLGILSFNKIKKVLATLSEKNIHILFFAGIFVLSILYHVTKFGFEQAGYLITFRPMPLVTAYKNPLDNYSLLKGKIQGGDVVMTDPLTGWLLPALTGAKITALYHNNPLVPDNDQRVKDSITFYDSATPLQIRTMILNKYKATHVVLNYDRIKENEINTINNYYQNFKINPRLIDDLHKLASVIFENEDIILFKLNTMDMRGRSTVPAVLIPPQQNTQPYHHQHNT